MGCMLIPAKGCIIVMGSGIADTVPGVKLMRKERTLSQSIKTKLQDFHARITERISQLFYFRCNNAKILCKDRKFFA